MNLYPLHQKYPMHNQQLIYSKHQVSLLYIPFLLNPLDKYKSFIKKHSLFSHPDNFQSPFQRFPLWNEKYNLLLPWKNSTHSISKKMFPFWFQNSLYWPYNSKAAKKFT